jgi:predicted nucleotidyltransferase component of viral defense system
VLPIVAKEACFALKGGTAINLFVREMPRLSVDIDLAYLPINSRTSALEEIDASLGRISATLEGRPHGFRVRVSKRQDDRACGLIISNGTATVKIEVSPVLRGAVYPGSTLRIVERAEAEFGFAAVPVVSIADLYAGKIVAALDRQHPRDLYDVMLLLAAEGINDEMFRAFIVYLISHDGSIARVLNPSHKPLQELFTTQFEGMTEHAVTIDDLDRTRSALISSLHQRLGEREKAFLSSFKSGTPDWDLLGIPHAAELPAVRWKLENLARMAPAKHRKALSNLESLLARL